MKISSEEYLHEIEEFMQLANSVPIGIVIQLEFGTALN